MRCAPALNFAQARAPNLEEARIVLSHDSIKHSMRVAIYINLHQDQLLKRKKGNNFHSHKSSYLLIYQFANLASLPGTSKCKLSRGNAKFLPPNLFETLKNQEPRPRTKYVRSCDAHKAVASPPKIKSVREKHRCHLNCPGVSFQVQLLESVRTPSVYSSPEHLRCIQRRNHRDLSSATARATSAVAIFSHCCFASSLTAEGSVTSS